MNLFSSIYRFIFVFAFFISIQVKALTIFGLNTGTCDRKIGVILDVDTYSIKFLDLKGVVHTLSRNEVIYVSYYNSTYFPLLSQTKIDLPITVIETVQDHKIVELLKGWAIDFSQDRIVFMTENGEEVLLERESIWNIYQIESETLKPNKTNFSIRFVQPFPFRTCKEEVINDGNSALFPQQSLGEPISIKRELDRLQQGFSEIKKYIQEKKFYSVPLIYKNRTSLGLWHMIGSRYGASVSRTNNLLPELKSEISRGPFGFQHQFITGVAPMEYGIHEETQSQFSYNYKASYFHVHTMMDPNILLLGMNYSWKLADFKGDDFKINDAYQFELGFDYGAWSLGIGGFGSEYGLVKDSTFMNHFLQQNHFNFGFRNLYYKIVFSFNSVQKVEVQDKSDTFDLYYYRVNVSVPFNDRIETVYSYIYRSAIADGKTISVKISSSNYSAIIKYRFFNRYTASGFVGYEQLDYDERNNSFFKLGSSIALDF